MFMQSAAMALGFGSFFQYGKRKISSMSNEEFNALTPEALTANLLSNVNNMIPSVQSSFHQMETMNVMILEAMAKYFSQGVQYLEKWIQGGAANLFQNLQGTPPDHTNPYGIPEWLPHGHAESGELPGPELPPGPTGPTGPVGPQQPTLDPLYAAMSQHTLYTMWKTNSSTWKLIPSTQKVLIIKSLKNYKPKDVIQKIKEETPKDSPQQLIAIAYQNMTSALLQYRKRSTNQAMKLALAYMKIYNRLVQSLGKAHLSVDTKKSLAQKQVVPK